MAYDAQSAYEPPRRAYYGQGPPPAPAQRTYGTQDQEQYGGYSEGYGAGDDQKYGQRYDQNDQYGGSDGYGKSMSQPQQRSSNNAYYEDHQRHHGQVRQAQRPMNGHGQQEQQYDRTHDPRYHQKPGKPNPSGYGQQSGQAAQQQQYAPRQDFRQQPHLDRPDRQMPPVNPQQPADPHNGFRQANDPKMQQYPRNVRPPAAPQSGRQTFEPQTADVRSPPGAQSNEVAPTPIAPAAQMPHRKKTTVEEWKARERAKLHAESQSPEILAQDNAFPVFRTKPKREPRSGESSSMSHRSSEEHTRPSTSGSHRRGEDHTHELMASMPRDNGYNRDGLPQQNGQVVPQSRPSQDGNPVPYSSTKERQNVMRPHPQAPHRPSYERQPPGRLQTPPQQPGIPTDLRSPTHLPAHNPQTRHQQRSPPQNGGYEQPPGQTQNAYQNLAHPRQRSPPQSGGYEQPLRQIQDTYQGLAPQKQRSPPQSSGYGQPPDQTQDAYQSMPPQKQRSPPQSGAYGPGQTQDVYQSLAHPQQRQSPAQPLQHQRPGTANSRRPVQPIELSQARKPLPPAYMDHQPLSPAYVPPRPSTAQGARAPSGPQQQDNLAKYPRSQTSHGYAGNGTAKVTPNQPPQPAQSQRSEQDALEDLYDGYNLPEPLPEPTPPVQAAPKTREEEIEAEMPDFDSAAPQQTSMLHKRQKTVDRHLEEAKASTPPPPMPAMPPLPAIENVAALSHPKTRAYQQQSDPYKNMAQQKHRQATSPNNGFDFNLPHQPDQRYKYDEGRTQPQQPQREMVYRQGTPPFQAPQPPYASEQPVRRSMDDARQMPQRHGPSQPQRFSPNGQPIKSGYPPQQPPGMDRSFSGPSVQSNRSDPAGQRVGSVPPIRQGMRELPSGMPNSTPHAQQSSGPERHQGPINPDALPRHPTPIRPGLIEGGGPQAPRPAPVRSYDSASISSVSSHSRPTSHDVPKPVTHAEIDQLRRAVAANPENLKQALLLTKKLAEAATVLASEGGRADPKTTARNRENYTVEAHKRIKKLASTGFPDAQFYLADCYSQGSLGFDMDSKEAFNLYLAAAKQNHGQAAYRTAVCCEMGPEDGGGTRRDFAKAMQWYRRAAALGDTAAMFKVGAVLRKGLLGQPKNIGEAIMWFKRAADRADGDNPHALHELATLYDPINTDPEVRNKVAVDEKSACELFQRAAGLGYKLSQFRLGQAYEYGTLGMAIDNRQSISWYSKAASQGEHQAELALSGWYLTGAEGILEHNETEAYLWARKAASTQPKAMYAMGYFSEMGIGCPANMDEARRWYGRAASNRFPKALERLEELKRNGKSRPTPANGRLMRKDQTRDETECAVM